MRGRIGGRIGATVLPGTTAPGIWGLGEVYAAIRGYLGYSFEYGGSAWPAGTISATWPYTSFWPYTLLDFIDATADGTGTFSPTITTTYESVSYSWEKSTDDGETWSTVSGETAATLELTGQTASNDGDKYRIVVDSGLRVARSEPGTVRFDPPTVSFSYHPQSQSVAVDDYVYLDAYASAIGPTYSTSYTPTMQWQVSTDGGTTWADTGSPIQNNWVYKSFMAAAGDNGKKFRLVASFGANSATSNVATITVT